MRLPNALSAVVDVVKLRDYCLSFEHPRGRHKARVFASALGITVDQVEELRSALLHAAVEDEAWPSERDDYGQRYVIDFDLVGPTGFARVRSNWIVRSGEDFPRLTSCHVLRSRG